MQFKKKGKCEGRNARDGIFVHASGMKIELFDFLIFIAEFPFFLHSLPKKKTAHFISQLRDIYNLGEGHGGWEGLRIREGMVYKH